MPWIVLCVAGLLEIVWAVGLKHTGGFTRLGPSAGVLAAMGASFYLLSLALRTLPVGTAYAVWVGIGAAGVALVGMLALGEPASPVRVGLVTLIIVAVVGLRLTDPPTNATPASPDTASAR